MWDVLPSKEVEIDADRTRLYNRVRQMSVTLREAATFGIKVIMVMMMAVGVNHEDELNAQAVSLALATSCQTTMI